MATFGIVVGGGPAPGINGVIGAAALLATRHGHRVIGLMDGFSHVMEGRTDRVRELRADDVATIHLQGGSILHTARANPTKKPEHLEAVVRSLGALGIDHLITIGGDDTAFSAKRVADTAGVGSRSSTFRRRSTTIFRCRKAFRPSASRRPASMRPASCPR